MTDQPKSAREFASAYLRAKTARTKQTLRDAVAERASVSKRARWPHLLAAIDAGDTARLRYYAAEGAAKRDALKAIQPKAEPKPAKAPTRAKAPAKAPRTKAEAKARKAPASAPASDLAKAADLLGLEADKLAAFVALLR